MDDGANLGAGTGNATPWHQGVDAAILGHWQNKAYDLSDPAKVAIAATQAAIEAQRFVGVPPDQLLRLPKDTTDAAGWDTVHQRLGTPKEAKDYDFTGVKFSDGSELDDNFSTAMRSALHKARVSKDAAPEIVKSVIKFFDDADKSEASIRQSTLDSQKGELKKSWGTRHDENLLQAKQGARRLGIDPETINALENVLGYDKIMEMFRKVGAGSNEDTFVDGGVGGNSVPATQEAAIARLAELQSDKAWVDRLFKGDVSARRELDALNQQIAGVAA